MSGQHETSRAEGNLAYQDAEDLRKHRSRSKNRSASGRQSNVKVQRQGETTQAELNAQRTRFEQEQTGGYSSHPEDMSHFPNARAQVLNNFTRLQSSTTGIQTDELAQSYRNSKGEEYDHNVKNLKIGGLSHPDDVFSLDDGYYFDERGDDSTSAIQLCRVTENGKIHLNRFALENLAKVKKKIGVISIAGPYRTGKSFLLNRIAGHQTGFRLGSTTNPCTEGLWIWGKPISISEEMDVILIDSEGLNSFQRDENSDLVLFAITCFLSSSLIYNTMGAIDERAIERLGFIANIKNFFKIKSTTRSDPNNITHEIAKYFPQFSWVLRDFTLELYDQNLQKPITPSEYFETALLLPPNAQHTEELKYKSQIRDCIRDYFRERNCYVLPRPVSDEKLLRNVEELSYESLKPKFRESTEQIVSYLRATLKPKLVNNVAVDGIGFVKFIEAVTAAINCNSLPTLSTTWDRIIESEMRDTLERCHTKYKAEIDKIQEQLPLEESELFKLLFIVKLEAVKELDSFKYSSEKCRFLRDVFQHKSKVLEEDLIDANDRKSREICEALEKKILKEMSLQFEALKSEDLPPGFNLSMFDSLRSQYLEGAVGTYKYDVFITSLMNQFMINMDQLYMRKNSNLIAQRNELEVLASQLQGKYEALKEVHETNHLMTQNILQSNSRALANQVRQIEDTVKGASSGTQVINGGLINMAEVKKANDNFNQLMTEFRRQLSANQEEKLQILLEKETLRHERVLQSELERVHREQLQESEERRRRYDKDISLYKEEIKRLEIIRQENLSIILQKEAEIRFLQEKIKHDERMKHTQVEHGKMLCNISDQIMSMLQKYDNMSTQ